MTKTKKGPYGQSLSAISEIGRLTRLRNSFLFLIKVLSIIYDFTVGHLSKTNPPLHLMENWNEKIFISPFTVITFGVNCHSHCGYLGWDVSNKHNYYEDFAFYDILHFFPDLYAFRLHINMLCCIPYKMGSMHILNSLCWY